MSKPIVLTCANHKGGSGKTSMSGALINALAEMGYKVLGIDGDMQQNLSSTYGLRDSTENRNLYQAIVDVDEKGDDFNGADYIVKTAYENIDFVISNPNMALIENILLLKMAGREYYVKEVIDSIKETEEYDFIVFDTNPTLGILNMNIFIASDYIVMPVECTSFGVDGLGAMITFLKSARKVNNNLKIAGVVMQKVDDRKNVVKDAIEVVKDTFKGNVFETMIHVDTNIEKSQWNETPLFEFAPKTRAANEYRELAKEVVDIVSAKSPA